MRLSESEALKLWSSLQEDSDEKLRFLAKTDGDLEAAKWAFIREYSKPDKKEELVTQTDGFMRAVKYWPQSEHGPMTMTVAMVICLFIPPLFIVSIFLFIWLMNSRGGWPYLGAYITHNLATGLAIFLITQVALSGFELDSANLSRFALTLFVVLGSGVAFYVGTFTLIYVGLFKVKDIDVAYGLALLSLLMGYISNLAVPFSVMWEILRLEVLVGILAPLTFIYGSAVYFLNALTKGLDR